MTGSLFFHARETHIALFSQSWKYNSHKDTHKKQNAGHFRVFILLNSHAKNNILFDLKLLLLMMTKKKNSHHNSKLEMKMWHLMQKN